MSCNRLAPLTLSASSISIGDDLSSEILKRLPTKNLCRFRCVCKLWNSLISSSFFINLHHSSPSSTPPGLKPYLRITSSPNSRDDYTLFHPLVEFIGQDLAFSFRSRLHRDISLKLNLAFDFYLRCVDVIHGVVCVSDYGLNHTVLWNPAIRKYIDLPRASFCCSAIGFGYDRSKNDFKVVRIRIPNFAYEVYTVRDGFWRLGTIDCNDIKTYCRTTGRTGCFVNGTIHWLIATPNREAHALLMFDCEHEEFVTMELPEGMTHCQNNRPRFLSEIEILKYADMLSALVRVPWDHMVLWVMEEHTWKKLYRISDDYIYTYIPSLAKLSPYGPDQWLEFNGKTGMFKEILSRHVYEESLCLMDHPKALSYPKDPFIYI